MEVLKDKNGITKDKNGEDMPHLEIAELLLVHCSLVNNYYQLDSRILYTFVPNKPFGSLLEMSPTNHNFLIQNSKKSKYGLQIKLVGH